jgi:hypothetical protein
VGSVESGIDEAYGQEPEGQLHGCPACSVTWFGADARCWVCGGPGYGPVVVVPPNGSETWSAARCTEGAEDEETAAFVRRVIAAAGTTPSEALVGFAGEVTVLGS